MKHTRILGLFVLLGLSLWLLSACQKPASQTPPPDLAKIEPFLLKAEPGKYDLPVGTTLDNKIQILGVDYEPKPLAHGKPYTITFYFKVLGEMKDDYEFFGHFEPANGQRFRAKMDHFILGGRYKTSQWRKGDIIKDVFKSTMPGGFPDAKGVIWGGFYKGDYRMPVIAEHKDRTDAEGRVKIATLPLDEPSGLKRELEVYKAKGKIEIDGKLDEPAWEKAADTGEFVNVGGDEKPKPLTTAKFLYDDKNLYVAFLCDDDDIWTTYTKRDDPLYREETTEIMIDADGSGSTYYEIQVNAANVVYDAYFPERRKDMDIKWDSKLKSAVGMDGTLNKREDKDKRWIVEIAIPFEVIADAKNKPAKPGDKWRLNLYRMERPAKQGTIAGMWSPTLVGDFHTLDRFGTIAFSATMAEERAVAALPKPGDVMKPVDAKDVKLQPKVEANGRKIILSPAVDRMKKDTIIHKKAQ